MYADFSFFSRSSINSEFYYNIFLGWSWYIFQLNFFSNLKRCIWGLFKILFELFKVLFRLLTLFKECVISLLIFSINLFNSEYKPSLCAILNWNIIILIEKELRSLGLFLNGLKRIKWLFRHINYDFIFNFFKGFCIVLIRFLFVFNFFIIFSIEMFNTFSIKTIFREGFVFYFKWFNAFTFNNVISKSFTDWKIMGAIFLNIIFAINRFMCRC